MAKIVAIANQKGGVGKTTTAVNLSSCVAALGKRVLIVDLDPQGNTTTGYGIPKRSVEKGTYEILIGEARASEAIRKTEYRTDVIGSNTRLAGASLEMIDLPARESRLRKALAEVQKDYDFIFIDCPPSLDLLTLNGLSACDSVLIPVQCEYYALEGVSSLMNTISRVKHTFNPSLEIEGVLLTMLDGRTNLSLQVVESVKKHFRDKVFSVAIPRNVRLGEAPSHGVPIHLYDPRSQGAESYRQLAQEIIRRGITVVWWGNIRFEKSYTEELCDLLQRSGCIAVSGGLEVASPRLLKLINKGVTVAQVARVANNFTGAGIMVHAYLMYGFPTQTAQETIDSLETIRQMFELGLIQSGFWHRFAMTAHSPVGLHPAEYSCRVTESPFGGFARNDVQFEALSGCDPELFSEGLRVSLYNYMNGTGFDLPLHKWFGGIKVPRTTLPPNYIEKILEN